MGRADRVLRMLAERIAHAAAEPDDYDPRAGSKS